MERQNLSAQLKANNVNQVVYIKNDFSDVLQNYNFYLEKFEDEKK